MTTHYSDTDLTAYLDRALNTQERTRLEAALQADASLRARVNALDMPMDALREGFGHLAQRAPAAPTRPNLPARAPSGLLRRSTPLLAASLVGAVIAGVWMSQSPLNAPPSQTAAIDDWRMAVAQYQALYVTETLSGAGAPAGTLDALSGTLGRDLQGADTAPGLTFARAQMLGFQGRPLVQIAYLSDQNAPFALCVTPVSEADADLTVQQLAGLAAAHWVDGGYGFVLIGGDDLQAVTSIAQDLRHRL